jgi:cytochrome c oxidase subunit 2
MQRTGIALIASVVYFLPLCAMQAQQAERIVEIHARRFTFEPSQISVKAGETVRLRLISDDVPHSLVVRQLNLELQASKSHPGESVLKAVTPGDYAGRCGRFCGSGHGRMNFTVHVNRD